MNDIDALKIISQFISSFQTVRSVVQECEAEVSFRDNEYNDLTHALELTTFDAASGYKMAKQLKENRMKRRKAKDQLAQLQPLLSLLNRYQSFFHEMKKVKKEIEKIRAVQQNRIYTPRARTDMMEAFERALAAKKANG